MSYQWKVGDAYTVPEYKGLNVLGRITGINTTCIVGAEIWFNNRGQAMEFHVDCYRYAAKMQRLVPEEISTKGGKTESLPELTEGAACLNGPDCNQPPCQEHCPVDQWKEGLPAMSQQEHIDSLLKEEV